jgi:hypothetical protein
VRLERVNKWPNSMTDIRWWWWLTAIGLLPGGSGYFTCKENMKLVTNKFKLGWVTWEACSGNLECWEPSQHLLIDTGKPRKTCVEVAGRRTFRVLTSSQQSGIWSKKQQYTHSTINTHNISWKNNNCYML